jgi:hypothetical protein
MRIYVPLHVAQTGQINAEVISSSLSDRLKLIVINIDRTPRYGVTKDVCFLRELATHSSAKEWTSGETLVSTF